MATPDSVLNPYARFLTGRDIYDALSAAPDELSASIAGLGDDVLVRRPAPGKWSIRDIICHLADTEIVFAFRLRQTVAEAHHRIQPFDQDAWAAPYGRLDAREALRAFAAARRWNVAFVRAVVPDALTKPVTHPERGSMTFRHILETMAGHDVNHARQIERLAGR